MMGLSAVDFTPPKAPTFDKFMNSVSRKIERSLGDFDRSHQNSLSKRQVQYITKSVYQRLDLAIAKATEGNAILNIMLHGSPEEVESLQLEEVEPSYFLDIAEKVEVGIKRLKYAFFVASASPAWLPHLATLKHLESRSLQAFGEYAQVTKEIGRLLPHFLESSCSVDFNIEDINNSLSEEVVEHPGWVSSGEDFAKWIRGIKA